MSLHAIALQFIIERNLHDNTLFQKKLNILSTKKRVLCKLIAKTNSRSNYNMDS